MEFFKIRIDIPFMRHALAFNVVSLLTFLLAVFFLATKGLNFSIEFTGGTVMEVRYQQAADVESVRKALAVVGYQDTQVQNFGTSRDILIRLPLKRVETDINKSTARQSEQVFAELTKTPSPGEAQASSPKTARSPCSLPRSASSAISRCASNGNSGSLQSSPTCTTW